MFRHHSVLVDVVAALAIADLRRIGRAGKPPRVLVITDPLRTRAIASTQVVCEAFGIPALMDPDGNTHDADSCADPRQDATLRDDDIEVIPAPGASPGPGAIMLYSARDGGILFSNDVNPTDAVTALGGRPVAFTLPLLGDPIRHA